MTQHPTLHLVEVRCSTCGTSFHDPVDRRGDHDRRLLELPPGLHRAGAHRRDRRSDRAVQPAPRTRGRLARDGRGLEGGGVGGGACEPLVARRRLHLLPGQPSNLGLSVGARAGRGRVRLGASARASRDAGGRVGVLLVERLVLEQSRVRERVELAAVPLQQARRPRRCASSTTRRTSSSTSFCVSGETSATPGRSGPAPSRGSTAIGPIAVAHPPAPDHLARDLRQLLDVGLRAGARLAEDDLLRGAAAERDLDLRLGPPARGS